MRGARWLLLLAMVVIAAGVTFTYRAQKRVLDEHAVPKPAVLSPDLSSTAENYHLLKTNTNTNRKVVDITARDFRQMKDSTRVDLKDVALKLFSSKGETYDLVKSAEAAYLADQHRLYSEGEVEITLGVPEDGPIKPDLVAIKSSGVTFDSETGRAETDRLSTFTFRRGDGQATGASYDPGTRELHMKQSVEVHFKPAGPHARPMKIEGSDLTYNEAQAEIRIPAWGRLTRNQTVVEGYESVVRLEDHSIRQVTTKRATGSDDYPNRRLQYAADTVVMAFDDDGQVQKITGQGNAHLVTTSEGSETSIAAPQVELEFEPQNGESILKRVLTTGASEVTSKPLPVAGRELAETRILRSDNIDMQMRPGGREIETLVTHTPGKLEFVPNQPAQRHRTLDGAEMVIAYGAQNRIESFRARNIKTFTDPTAEERKKNRPQAVTSSKDLLARFDPASSRMSSLDQSGEFHYDEGDRHARAAKASLDQGSNVMLLETGARVWDSTGSTTADRIHMEQNTGNFTAEGNVRSSRLADPDQKSRPGMLSGDEPLEAQADRMDSADRNRRIHYEGRVSIWQGANRLQAGVVDVDRTKQTVVADKDVVSNLWQQPKADTDSDTGKKPSAPVLVLVRAPHMVYTDKDRLAEYSGGVRLDRPGMQVKSKILRAYLADSSADSRLEKAFAEGAVEIVQKNGDLVRNGTSEHAEYYPDSQKTFLSGGQPHLVETLKGQLKGETHGCELTYFGNDDRLLVSGCSEQPVKSRIRRK